MRAPGVCSPQTIVAARKHGAAGIKGAGLVDVVLVRSRQIRVGLFAVPAWATGGAGALEERAGVGTLAHRVVGGCGGHLSAKYYQSSYKQSGRRDLDVFFLVSIQIAGDLSHFVSKVGTKWGIVG